MDDLIERLRALSRHEHSDYSIGDEAADMLEAAQAERKVVVAEALKYAGKSGRLEAKVYLLAEALREIESKSWNGVRPIQIAARAALRNHNQENK